MGSVSSIQELRADPARLVNGASPERLEFALLDGMRTITVPAGAKELIWNALSAELIGSGLSAVAGANSWANAFWRAALKLVGSKTAVAAVPVMIVALGAGAVQYERSQREAGASQIQAQARTVPAPPATSSKPMAATPNAQTDNSETAPSASVAPGSANRSATRDPLREESTLLERARAELRGGHPREAQVTLLRLQRQFPKGALTQEREVLLIEALAARGKAEAAARDAESFIATHPESPHAQQLRRFLEPTRAN
ncbi:MAG TPA: outer membrane protein assembly factor BamD [Polyangiaceae bacterium]|nr:outer membrane protein assembly factor BamD [Polyangiaceae bacterium]